MRIATTPAGDHHLQAPDTLASCGLPNPLPASARTENRFEHLVTAGSMYLET